jgi:hypothetical protein
MLHRRSWGVRPAAAHPGHRAGGVADLLARTSCQASANGATQWTTSSALRTAVAPVLR